MTTQPELADTEEKREDTHEDVQEEPAEQSPEAEPHPVPQSPLTTDPPQDTATKSGGRPVIVARISPEAMSKIDMIVDAGLVKSRSEAASYLIDKGIGAKTDLFDSLTQGVTKIREQRAMMQDLLQD